MPAADIRHCARPCLLAGAVGDAWGGAYEGGPPSCNVGEFPKSAVLSDDTQLTLATCEALTLTQGKADPDRIAQSFRRWFEEGRLTNIGSATLKALRDLSAGAHWALSGARGEFAAGAGAAMRVAPLAFVLDPSISDDRRTLRDICRITHHSDEAYTGALAAQLVASAGAPVPDRLWQGLREAQTLSASVDAFVRCLRESVKSEAERSPSPRAKKGPNQ